LDVLLLVSLKEGGREGRGGVLRQQRTMMQGEMITIWWGPSWWVDFLGWV
jgi:hypothetical protein